MKYIFENFCFKISEIFKNLIKYVFILKMHISISIIIHIFCHHYLLLLYFE